MEFPYSLNGGFMHPNEIRITKENQERLIEEAQKLGQQHVTALMEQIERQGEKTK
jgi:predicted DNA-binding protein